MSETCQATWPAKVMRAVARADAKAAKMNGYGGTPISDWMATLARTGSVEVGYRQTCGVRMDSTMKVYGEWKKVLKAMRACGIVISETPVKHKNAYATINGGFWHSTIYSVSLQVTPSKD